MLPIVSMTNRYLLSKNRDRLPIYQDINYGGNSTFQRFSLLRYCSGVEWVYFLKKRIK